jgi:hypothetical protein
MGVTIVYNTYTHTHKHTLSFFLVWKWYLSLLEKQDTFNDWKWVIWEIRNNNYRYIIIIFISIIYIKGILSELLYIFLKTRREKFEVS